MTDQLAAMPRYEEYKDSGVKWLGKIPTHWEMIKLKYEAKVVLGKMLCTENKGMYQLKSYLKSKNIQWLNVDLSSVDEMWFSKPELKEYRLRYGDLVLSEDGEVGKTCIWNNELEECYIQNSAHKVTFTEQNHSRYFLYLFFIAGKIGFFDSIVNRVSIAHLTREKLANINFIIPNHHEQTAIAAYLDHKTEQIDQAVEIKKKKVALLKEHKQILIQNAVTRGLAPDAPMRDSGVDWIGKIRAHWNIVANRSLFKERVEPGQDELPLLSVSIHSGVSTNELNEDENIRSRVKIEDKTKYNLVKPDDIVFNMMRAWQGAIGAVKVKGMVSPAYIIAIPKGSINSQYFEYQYRCPIFIQQMDRFSKGITDFRKRLYWHEFKQFVTLLPPAEEQTAIVAHIETQSAKIDRAIGLQEQQIDKLKEYKATLINSAVTGKIKVPMSGNAEAVA